VWLITRFAWRVFIFSFTAGLGAGTTEAILVVNPMEVVKIRLQAQQHSLADPMETPRYRNAGHAVYTIIREEGVMMLLSGRLPHCSAASYQPRCQLYRLPGDQETVSQHAT